MKLRIGPAAASLWWAIAQIRAAEFMHLDGIERIAKSPEITEPARLAPRDDGGSCGTSMKLCPSSLDGGCCPEDYDCGKNSCFATTRGPSTCGSLVGWYACAAVYGGGCCPDGYKCHTAGSCMPPSATAITFGCPASYYLCPESLSYGCCPDGMGCAVNQCYSTESRTITAEEVITTTRDGERTTYTTKRTTVREPSVPTSLPDADVEEDNDQEVFKFFPSVIAKEEPSKDDGGDDDNGDSSLSDAELAGIVAGAVAFLIIVIVAAFIIIRHLNKVVAVVGNSQQSGTSGRPRPPMKEFRFSDSEIDALSIDPLIMSPGRTDSCVNSTPDALSSTDMTPSSFAGAYQTVNTANSNSRLPSWEGGGHMVSYFDNIPGRHARFSVQSGGVIAPTSNKRLSDDSQIAYHHIRDFSNGFEEPGDMNDHAGGRAAIPELENTTVGPELPGSPTTLSSPNDEERRRSSGGTSIASLLNRAPPSTHQRLRNASTVGDGLSIVDEEGLGLYDPHHGATGHTAWPPSRHTRRRGDSS